MESEIKTKNADGDLLSQSYSGGIERIVGFKNDASFKVPPGVLRKRKEFWDDLFNRYSSKLLDDIEVDIATLRSHVNIPFKSVSFIQYWVNTGNLPFKALMDGNKNSESEISLTEGNSSNSLNSHVIKEKSNEYCKGPNCSASSFSTSIDTAAYILSNTNTTNKVETMAIVEGAKHNAPTNHNKSCENVETVQFATDDISNKDNENVMLDNNGNAYQTCLLTPPSKPPEHLTQQTTNNLQESIIKTPTNFNININKSSFFVSVNKDNVSNCNSERCCGELFNAEMAHTINADRDRNSNVRRKLNEMHMEQISLIDESSTLENNTTKLNSRKKLYSGRDSPVDLVHTRSSNKNVLIKPNRNLHPALIPEYKISKGYKIYKKKQGNNFSIVNKYMLNSSQVSFSSYRKRKRRRKTLRKSYVGKNLSIIDTLKKRDSLIPEKTANNPIKNQSFTEPSSVRSTNSSPSPNETVNTNSNKDSTRDNSIVQVEKCINQFLDKSNNALRTVIHLNPRVCLSRLSKRDVQKYKNSTKTTTSIRNLYPVVRLNRLSESDIQKHRKPSRTATKLGSLSPIASLKQLSKISTPKRRKLNDSSNLRFRNPVVRLKKLSKLDIERYKTETTRSQNSDTANVFRNPSAGRKTIHLAGDSDSDDTTVLICECKSVTSQSHSSLCTSSIKNSRQSPPPIEAPKNRNSVRKDTSHKDTGPNNRVLHETLEMTRNEVCTNEIMVSASNGSHRITERRSLRKNLRTSVNSLKTDSSVLPKEGLKENHDTMSRFYGLEISSKTRSNGAYTNKNTKPRCKSYDFLLSDEDDGFVNLIYYHDQRRKSQLLHKSPQRNTNDSIEIQNTGRRAVNGVTNNELQCLGNGREGAMRSRSIRLRSGSIRQNKFEEERGYSYAKRNASILSCLSEEENIHHANPVSVQKFNVKSLSTRKDSHYTVNKSQVVLRDRKKLLTNAGAERGKSKFDVHHLRFETKFFDTDSESSYLS